MYEELYQPIPDACAYARRIHLDFPVKPDISTLDTIIYLNQCHIPFENLDVADGRRIPSLKTADLFHKIVENKRGGYCFELNKLFCAFLTEIGYHCWPVSCRIVWKKDHVPALLHEAVLVDCDGILRFCDVGYGGPQPGASLPLIDGTSRTIFGNTYHVRKSGHDWWQILLKKPDMPAEPMVEFLTAPMPPSTFIPLNYYCSTFKEFRFYQDRVVNLRIPGGNLALLNMEFTEQNAQNKITRTLANREELKEVLFTKFGIDSPYE